MKLTVSRILDNIVIKCDCIHGIVTATTNATNRQPMATRANPTAEGNFLVHG